jgi:glycosyltransferase involved in cell wall biosynthesis
VKNRDFVYFANEKLICSPVYSSIPPGTGFFIRLGKDMISVNIITKNEENNISDCIDSVISWVDEIVVVDSESTDRTAELCRREKVRFITRPWEGWASQRQFALEQSSHENVLVLDADERVSPELKEEILALMQKPDSEFCGYRIPRRTYFLNRWIKEMGWYPGYQLRFFRKSKTHVPPRLVHEGYEVDGPVGVLQHDIIHYSITDINKYAYRNNLCAYMQAQEMINRRKVGFKDILLRPIATLIRTYIFKKGYKDGIQGLMVAYFDAITNVLTYMNIWDLQHREDRKK